MRRVQRASLAVLLAVLFAGASLVVAAGKSDVADAAMKDDVATVRMLIQQKADVNGAQVDGARAIHWAVYHDDVAMADLLIKAGADVKTPNREGATPLSMASQFGNPAMIERLLKAGADAKERGPNGETTVMYAARNGNRAAIKLLVGAGADVNARERLRGTTALMWASEQRHSDAVRMLLEFGADHAATSGPAGLPRNYMANRVNANTVQQAQERYRRAIAAGRTYEEQLAIEQKQGLSTAFGGPTPGGSTGLAPGSGGFQAPGAANQQTGPNNSGLPDAPASAEASAGRPAAPAAPATAAPTRPAPAQPANTAPNAAPPAPAATQHEPSPAPAAPAAGQPAAAAPATAPAQGAPAAPAATTAPAAPPAAAPAPGGRARGAGAGRQGAAGGRQGGARGQGQAPAAAAATDPDDDTEVVVAGLVGTGGGGLTALSFAARECDMASAKALLDAGADVNQRTEYGWTPLLIATNNRCYQLGKFLIERGADVNIANKGGWTPIYLATDNRNIEGGDYPVPKPDMDSLEYIKLLLDHNANPNVPVKDNTLTRTIFTMQWFFEDGATPFVRAAQSSDVALMKLLLDYKADPKATTAYGDTALTAAAGIGWVEGVTYERSAKENLEAVRLLLDLGLDPNAANRDGRTPLMGAALKGRTDVIQLLVDRGAKLDQRDRGSRDTDKVGSLLAGHTWQAVDYADGLVRTGVQSAVSRPEAGKLIRKLMADRGMPVPPENRVVDSICVVELCQERTPAQQQQ